jgi:hypothetical protein
VTFDECCPPVLEGAAQSPVEIGPAPGLRLVRAVRRSAAAPPRLPTQIAEPPGCCAKLRDQLQRLGVGKLCVAAERLWVASERLCVASERLGVASERLCVASERLCVASERHCVASERLGVASERLGVASERLGVASERLCRAPDPHFQAANAVQGLPSPSNALIPATTCTISPPAGMCRSGRDTDPYDVETPGPPAEAACAQVLLRGGSAPGRLLAFASASALRY